MNVICNFALENGLPSDHLSTIVNIVSRKTELDQTSVNVLAKNLYPADRVSSSIVTRIVGCLGSGKQKATASTQALLLRWILNVYGIIDDADVLSQLYGVLFNLLDMTSLRTLICHLLSLVTRRRHVRPYRIQQLLELVRSIGEEPALLRLLRVFKDYYPEIIVGNVPGRYSLPPQPDKAWRERINVVLERDQYATALADGQSNGFRGRPRRTKGSSRSKLPELRTSYISDKAVTLEEIANVDDFVDHMERIELPNQLISTFTDPLLRQYMKLNPSEIAWTRFEMWLSTLFDDEIETAKRQGPPSEDLLEVLRRALNYARHTGAILPVFYRFLIAYIPMWDANTGTDVIMDVLAFLALRTFEELNDDILAPLRDVIFAKHEAPFGVLIPFLTKLVRCGKASVQPVEGRDTREKVNSRRCLGRLIDHTWTICLSALASLPQEPGISSIVLSFCEEIAEPSSSGIFLLPAHMVYLLLLSPSLSNVSRLCGVLAQYKRAFVTHTELKTYPRKYTSQFNGYLMDTSNLLWRMKGLSGVEPNTKGCLCPKVLKTTLEEYLQDLNSPYSYTYELGSVHGLCHSIALCPAAAAVSSQLNLSELPLTQKAFRRTGGPDTTWMTYRRDVLQWLEAHGVPGVGGLMHTTMQDLMKPNT